MESDYYEIFCQSEPPCVTAIYQLGSLCKDFNRCYINGRSLLEYALLNWPNDLMILHALLQCGCNTGSLCRERPRSLFGWVTDPSSPFDEEVREIFRLYHPGLIVAIQQDRVELVRKLINLWCRTDIEQDGKTAKMYALEKGTEQIISLIKLMTPTMNLAHAVLANDIAMVESTLIAHEAEPTVDGDQLDVNVRHLGAYGAPPVCYAIQHNNCSMVRLLLKHGAKPAMTLSLTDESEFPVAMLAMRNNISWETFRLIVDHGVEHKYLESLRYESDSVLHFAVSERIDEKRCRHLLNCVSPRLTSSRNQFSLTAQDMAAGTPLATVFEKHIDSLFREENVSAIMDLIANGNTCVSRYLDDFSWELDHRKLYVSFRDHVQEFVKAVESDNAARAEQLVIFHGEGCHICVADCKAMSNGQPPLHKAVLRSNLKMVVLLTDTIINILKKKLDDIRDHHCRPALSYAHAASSPENDLVVRHLIDNGASEFALDRSGRSPLSFRELRASPLMCAFLEHHRLQLFEEAEPDLWESPSSTPEFSWGPAEPANRTGSKRSFAGVSHGFAHRVGPYNRTRAGAAAAAGACRIL